MKRTIIRYFETHALVAGVAWVCVAALLIAGTVQSIAGSQ